MNGETRKHRLILIAAATLFAGCSLVFKTPDIAPGLPAPDSGLGFLPPPTMVLERVKTLQQQRAKGAPSDEGWKALERGDLTQAAAQFQRALKANADDLDAHLGLAWTEFKLGNMKSAANHARPVMNGGGEAMPQAAQLIVTAEMRLQRYAQARSAAEEWAKWAQGNGQSIMAMDAYLLASRISHQYMNDSSATYYNLEKARALVNPADAQAAARFTNYERELQRLRMGKY